MPKHRTYIDIETQSRVSIKKGLVPYFSCPDFKILTANIYDCSTDQEFVMWHEDLDSVACFYEAIRRLARLEHVFVAHNAAFEFGALLKVLGEDVPRDWRCTMALAMGCGLPASLELCSAAMLIPLEKMYEGKRLINTYSIPNGQGGFNKCTPSDRRLFMKYCKMDRAICQKIDEHLPDINDDVQFFYITALMNIQGIPLDMPLLKQLTATIESLKTDKFCHGINTKSTKQLKDFCSRHGVSIPDCQKATLSSALQNTNLPQPVREVLEKRQAANRSSMQKYLTAQASNFKGRLHGPFKYYGATTGRDAGTDFQAQNLPRSTPTSVVLLPMLRHLHCLPSLGLTATELARDGLRAIFSSSKGFLCVDLTGIELRVLHWFASCQNSLDAFRKGGDLYKDLASDIYNVPTQTVTKDQRSAGKEAVLSLGYGAGVARFAVILMEKGVVSPETPCCLTDSFFQRLASKNKSVASQLQKYLTEGVKNKYLANLVFADKIVKLYRRKYHEIVSLWYKFNDFFLDILSHPHLFNMKTIKFDIDCGFTTIKIIVWRKRSFISVQLPSKRRLHYFSPRIEYDNEGKEQMYYLKHRPDRQLKKEDVNVRFKNTNDICVLNGIVFKKTAFWGGTIVQNITQAIARDVFFEGHLAAHKAGYQAVARVHDELLVERSNALQSKDGLIELMTRPVPWAPDLPLAAEGWEGHYYRKE